MPVHVVLKSPEFLPFSRRRPSEQVLSIYLSFEDLRDFAGDESSSHPHHVVDLRGGVSAAGYRKRESCALASKTQVKHTALCFCQLPE